MKNKQANRSRQTLRARERRDDNLELRNEIRVGVMGLKEMVENIDFRKLIEKFVFGRKQRKCILCANTQWQQADAEVLL